MKIVFRRAELFHSLPRFKRPYVEATHNPSYKFKLLKNLEHVKIIILLNKVNIENNFLYKETNK